MVTGISGTDSRSAQTDIIAVQRVMYKQSWSFACKRRVYSDCLAESSSFPDQWLLVMSTQMIGLSAGGIARRLLVAPPSMSEKRTFDQNKTLTEFLVWPNTLVICALFNTLHSQRYLGADDTGPSRERFFAYAFIGAALWCEYFHRVLVVKNSLQNIS
jgi:hypothetical protein